MYIVVTIDPQQASSWIKLAINAKKSQFGTKFLEIKEVMSYLLITNYYLLNTFFADFLGNREFQIKSGVNELHCWSDQSN